MPPIYNASTDRTGAGALIPPDISRDIIKGVVNKSAALELFKRAPNMSTGVRQLPVLSALPQAYFVSGDTGLKQTTKAAWANKYLYAEEIAVIQPVPDAILDDANYDLWAEVQPEIESAIADAIDGAIFLGINKPASWPTAVVPAAVAAGNYLARGVNDQAHGGVAQDVYDAETLVEADGFVVSGFVANPTMKGRLRGARDTTGQQLIDVSTNTMDGSPIRYTMRGLWPSGASIAELIAGDFQQGILAIRQDITWTKLTEAALFDGDGNLVFNLAQQDMTAMRVVMRLGWQIANPITRDNTNDATRYPFAVLRSPA